MAENKAEALEALLEVGRLLSSKLDLGELLRTVLKLSAELVDAETASLLLLDEPTGTLYFHTALGLGPQAARLRLPLGQGIAGCVAQNRSAEIIADVRQDSRWSSKMDEETGFTTRSILAVPMLLKGRLIGVVEAINKRNAGFGASDLRTLEAFASQAAVAIDNATLFSALKEERRKLHAVFTGMTDGVLLTDAHGAVLLANEAARKLFAIGTPLDTLASALAGMDMVPPLAEIMNGRQASGDFTVTRRQPKSLILAGRATRISLSQNAGDETPGTLWLLRDVTEESQKALLKRSFLSLISHKLKTPLSVVTGFSDIVLAEFAVHPPNPALLKSVEAISAQGRKLAGLVDKLLRFTTLESAESRLDLAPCNLDEVVSAALQEQKNWLAEQKAAVAFKPAELAVVGDRKLLIEVVKNLVENAVKFADKPEKKVSAWIEPKDREVLLCVSDNGPGIPPEDQDRVFSQFHQVEEFFTGQVEGLGLGLPYVKKVVDLHGGSISLVSRLGEGTTVTVILPRSRA